jgi:hypothetical protein
VAEIAELPDAPPWMQRLERWLRRHRLAVIVAIAAASVCFRAVYFVQLSRGPNLWQHRWQQSDMSFFDAWARQIATGDWLTDRALHPTHAWAKDIAARHFHDFPEEARELERLAAASPGGHSAAALLWDRWYGGKQFHQEPLYPYLLAVTYALLAPDVRLVFLWQMVLGVLANVLICLLARRAFGDTVGTVAGAMAVLYAPLMYYELILLREAPMTFAGLACVAAVSWALDGNRAARWVAAGAVIGATILLKSTTLLFLLGVTAVLCWQWRRSPAQLARALGGLSLGTACLLAPAVARNVAVGCPALALSSVGPIGFIIANAEDFNCGDGVANLAWRHVGEILPHARGRLWPTVVETLRTHPDAWSVLRQLWAKFLAVWHWYEISDNANFYYYSLHASVLGWAPLRFVAVAPLALVGLALSWRRFRLTWPLLLMLATALATCVVFGPMSRYRLAVVPVLLIFAAAAAVRVVASLAARRWLAASTAAACTAALALWMARPLPPGVPLIRYIDYFMVYGYYYRPEAESYVAHGDYEGASDVIARSLAYEPEVVRSMGPSRPARDAYEAQLGTGYARLRLVFADYLARAGRREQALAERARAQELDWAVRANTEAGGS